MPHLSHVPDLGVANGIATLDGVAQVPLIQLKGIAGQLDNLVATMDPVQTNDVNEGYGVGSFWINTVTRRIWTCFDATANTAIWRRQDNTNQSEQLGRETPDEHYLGALMNYSGTGGATSGEIQYTRVWLISGSVITSMRCYISAGGSAARRVRMGLYSQADPLSVTGVPVNRIAQTNTVATAGANGAFFTQPLLASYTVGATGYYWVAIIQDSSAISFVTSQTYAAGFLPVRRESGTNDVLPATAGTLTNPTSAVIYVSGVE